MEISLKNNHATLPGLSRAGECVFEFWMITKRKLL